MIERTAPSTALAFAALLLFQLPLPGQQEAPIQADQPLVVIPDLQFGGGPLSEYAELLRKASGENILLDAGAGAVEVPPISLHNVSLDAALDVVPKIMGRGEDRMLQVSTIPGPSPVYLLLLQKRPETVEVLTLQGIIGGAMPGLGMKAETVLTAIENVLAETRDEGAPAIKFHPESSILVVKGNPSQIKVVKSVVERLSEGLEKVREAGSKARAGETMDAIRRGQAEVETLKLRLEATLGELQSARRMNEELRMEAEKMRSESAKLAALIEKLQAEAKGHP